MNRKPVIGIVGGIGAGKSHVSAELAKRGGQLIVGDSLGHDGLRRPDIKERVRARWGERVFDGDEIDRRALGAIVFADAAERHALEAIQFPYIGSRVKEAIEQAQRDPDVRFVILDAAVLLEAGWRSGCDHVLFVEAPRAVRLERLHQLRGWSDADIDARERNQLTLAEKRERSDGVIVNAGSDEELSRQLDEICAKWRLGAVSFD